MSGKMKEYQKIIRKFLQDKLRASGLSRYVVGISGGIDSALSAALAVEAIGPEKVLGILMPYKTSSKESVEHGLELINSLEIKHRQVDISPMIDAYFENITNELRLRAGNKMARERMSILFDISQETNSLVLGTGNRTEICLGYTTWYGDSACSLNPIGQLYKTEVRELSRLMGIPESILSKPPSADLWANQTDEGEIGVTYEQIDVILKSVIDDGEISLAKLTGEGFAADDINRVLSLMNRSNFKRHLPDIAQLGKISLPVEIVLKD